MKNLFPWRPVATMPEVSRLSPTKREKRSSIKNGTRKRSGTFLPDQKIETGLT